MKARVRTALVGLGAAVEFDTTAGNVIVARVPAGAVTKVAALADVARVVEDTLAGSDLDIADNATLVTSTKLGGGLWDNDQTGGTYDPAVVDTGSDLDHPFLDASDTRENHWSWYLVAGSGDPNYCDSTGSDWMDDQQGHGSHVMGIVAGEGSGLYPWAQGMSYGVDKAVHLKAGWLKCSDGRGSMYWSDKMWLVDRALNQQDELRPTLGVDEFNDDVDGFNLSFSGETTLDDPAGSQFWDAVVDDYADTIFTVSAGNSGPSNTLFNDPATTYNGITVANVDDKNTTSRDDDSIRSSSTRGPTASGRKKPDIAAPGTDIKSANNDWETETDWVSKGGTSMSAPMVLGVAMDLMDAGVFDEREIKALLLNTAQKNESGIDFESDLDGWSTAYGWGYMNAWAAYYHRGDVRTGSVTPRDTSGDYQLYVGQMRDEGAGHEGRDRATLVWNRHAVYQDHDYPGTVYGLNDLNLRLYSEGTGALVDKDITGNDNVHQVRVGSGAAAADHVVKVYAWSTSFNDVSSEPYALATEEDFVAVDLPADFQGIGLWATEMEPNEEQTFEFWLRNDSDIASHSNQFDLVLPDDGWSRIAGSDPFSAGSVAGDGGLSNHVTWTLKASNTPGSYTVISAHTHDSYAESYGPFNWQMGVTVAWDTTPPSPNPMTWATEPYELNTSQIRMVATTATDLHGPVEYYFDYYSGSGTGGTDSGWTTSTTYTDSGLQANANYCYQVRARDNATSKNNTAYSAGSCDYTLAQPPGAAAFTDIITSSIRANWTANGNPAGTRYRAENTTEGTSSGWTTATSWNSTGLSCGMDYEFRVRARNGDLIETNWVSLGTTSTASCADPCNGDFNNDGDVDGTDLALFSADFGRTDCSAGSPCNGDFNNDGDVDGTDLALFSADFGRTDCPI